MEEKTLTFDWTMSDWYSYYSTQDIRSPIFPNELIDNQKSQHLWFLRLTQKQQDVDLCLCLTWAKCKYYFCTEFELRFKFKSQGEWFNILSKKHLFHIDFNSIFTVSFISTRALAQLHADKYFGPLQISCKMKIQIDKCIIYANPKEIPEFERMFNNSQFSDFTVLTLEKEFKVHKNILATRSEVFAAMFQNDMKEKEQGSVKITDFEDEVVEELLRYIYCGRVENLEKLSEDLLKVADKYSVQGLKTICLEEICKKLTTENALELLSLIDYHKTDHLKTFVINFIVINVQKIDESHFKSLENLKLMQEIFLKTRNFVP